MKRNRRFHHKSKHTTPKYNHHCCRGPEGPMGPVGPTGPPGPVVPFTPFILNRQNKIVGPLDIKELTEEVVVDITITIPSEWISYDLIISGEVYADYLDPNCGVVMSFKQNDINGELIGGQFIGHNGTEKLEGVGFSGFHKEILNDLTQTGDITYCLCIKAVDTLADRLCEVTVINRYIHLQAIRQS